MLPVRSLDFQPELFVPVLTHISSNSTDTSLVNITFFLDVVPCILVDWYL